MNEKICRLCLQTIICNNCQAIDEYLLKSLKLNFKISEKNVMCIECANSLQVLSNFTAGCVYMQDGTLPLPDLENGIKLEPEPIETTSNSKSLMKTKIKCSFCTKRRGREDLISLRVSKENEFLVKILGQYISNLENIKEILTCDTCLEALEGVWSVILKCLEVEEKISKYIELKGTDDKGQVDLKKVQQFTFRSIIKLESESFDINKLEGRCDQIQEEYTGMVETEIKDEKQISNTELIIKTEDDIRSEPSDCDIINTKSEQSDGFQKPFNETKTPSDSLLISVTTSETRISKDLIKQHLSLSNPSEIKTFKCDLCSYDTTRKDHLAQHLLVHKSPSEIKMFKCEICSYEAKQKGCLNIHLLTHKKPSQIRMFKCELCSYEAKHKSNLKRHVLTHKSPSEIRMFKCELCAYKTKHNYILSQHLLIHKNPSEINMFKCEICSYEAKLKCSLKTHLLTHKNPSEIKMFKCEMCPYEAKRKIYLKQHLLTHKSRFEIKMFKCKLCPYEAKRKSEIYRHLLAHKRKIRQKEKIIVDVTYCTT